MNKTFLAVLCFALCVPLQVAQAVPASDERSQSTMALPEIRAAQDALKAELDRRNGPYAQYSESQRRTLREQQASIYGLLEGAQSVEDLGEDNRLRLANLLMAQKAQLEQKPEERMLCERVKVLGSNRPKVQCMSQSQREAMRHELRTHNADIQRGIEQSRDR